MRPKIKSLATENPAETQTRFALERTLLAWVRTGLALMGFGFVVARFGLFLREIEAVHPLAVQHIKSPTGISLFLGTVLIILGVAINLLASAEHIWLLRQFESKPPYGIRTWVMGIVVAIILAILGIAMAIYLLFVAQ
jgi:putative membrane protein